MDPKILLLVVVSVFAVAPEFTEAATPAFCKDLPIPMFPDESTVEKWAYNHKQNKCHKFVWGGDTKVRNYFDTEAECLKTCQPESASKPWILVGGRCLCRCPKCDKNDATVKAESKATPKPTVVPKVTTTTTETSLLRNFFRQ